MEFNEQELQDWYAESLMHFGVPGMKWGRRKARPVGNGRRGTTRKKQAKADFKERSRDGRTIRNRDVRSLHNRMSKITYKQDMGKRLSKKEKALDSATSKIQKARDASDAARSKISDIEDKVYSKIDVSKAKNSQKGMDKVLAEADSKIAKQSSGLIKELAEHEESYKAGVKELENLGVKIYRMPGYF